MPGFSIPTLSGCDDAGWGTPEKPYTGPHIITETARSYRYLVTIMNPLGNLRDGLLQLCNRCTRPSTSFEDIVIHHGPNQIHRPGKLVFEPVEFTFYESVSSDPRVNTMAQKLYKWWSKDMYDISTSKLSPPKADIDPGIYTDITIEMLDGEGATIWKYVLYEAFPLQVTATPLSYKDNNINEITVKVRYNTYRELIGGD